MAWEIPKSAFDKELAEYYLSFVPGVTYQQFIRYVKWAHEKEIVMNPVTFIASVKKISNESATELMIYGEASEVPAN